MKACTRELRLVIPICLFIISGKAIDRPRRFLTDSTDGSESHLQQLENSVRILMQTVNVLNNSVSELLSRNSLLGYANQLQDGLIHGLQNTLSGLEVNDREHEAKIRFLQYALSNPQTTLQPTTSSYRENEVGSSYIRWGKRRCPANNADIVYSGYAGGQQYSGNGGPTGMLCLPTDPDINNTTTTTGNSYIYGIEYRMTMFKSDANYEDVPCALCRSKNTVSSVMIPGRMTCYPGWKREYYGLLSSGSTGHSSSNYICVDIDPDYTPSGKDSKTSKYLYVASSYCGSLPCPPYKQGIPLYCVVCSK